MKYVIFIEIKQEKGKKLLNKEVEAESQDAAVHKAEQSLEKKLGADWKKFAKIMRVQRLTGF